MSESNEDHIYIGVQEEGTMQITIPNHVPVEITSDGVKINPTDTILKIQREDTSQDHPTD